MFKMLKLPDLKELHYESPSEADVSSDVSSSDSLLLDECLSTGRSSQEPAKGRIAHIPGGLRRTETLCQGVRSTVALTLDILEVQI